MFNLARSKSSIKKEILNNFKKIVLLMIVPIIITLVVIGLSIYSKASANVLSFLLYPITVSFILLGINYSRNPHSYMRNKQSLVPGINSVNDYTDILFLYVIVSVYTFLWSLLLIVPGIIKSFAYSQAIYVFMDAKESGNRITYNEAITKSRELMNGHKWNIFLLSLSFLGWSTIVGIVDGLSIGLLSASVGNSSINYALLIFGAILFIAGFAFSLFFALYVSYTQGSYYVALRNEDERETAFNNLP